MSIGKSVKVSSVAISNELLEKARGFVKKKKRGPNDLTAEERALIYRYQVECKDGEYISTRDLGKLLGIGWTTIGDIARDMRNAKNH